MRIFCPEPLASSPLHPLFNFRFTPERKIEGLFKDNLPPNYFAEKVEFVATPEDADSIILPNNFITLDEAARAYIVRYTDAAERHKKHVLVFSCGDHTDTLIFDKRVWVLRYSIYKSSMSERDICMPTLTEDLGLGGITLRNKQEIPTVSFCGKAGFGSLRELFAGILKRIGWELRGVFVPVMRARIRGVFWRIWSIEILKRSTRIKTFFIIRKTFSGAEKTIELDPKVARKEFVETLTNTDFVLAPKGDGNYSNRFLEALSMGRFPVLLDTDCVLPLEGMIDYSKIMVRVPMHKLSHMPEFIREFYDALTPQEYEERQKMARNTFEKYLTQGQFFEALLKNLLVTREM